MADTLAGRRADSATRLKEFQEKLKQANEIAKGKACVYVTGSFGRSEASTFSDLDLFIAGRSVDVSIDGGVEERRELRKLDEICLKAELIDGTRSLKFPEFSGDGEYLAHYTINQLVKTTGKPEDDVNNTFTARLLLLLESRALIGDDVYKDAIDAVISKYWGDYGDHKNEFVPAFLANDILRLWRTFCVNYEARTSNDPPEKKNKRRLKNYKLKYSRMLTCYSALLYLLAIHDKSKTVSPEDVRGMVSKSPTERLEWLLSLEHLKDAHGGVRNLLEKYEQFLNNTNADEKTLLERISDKATRRDYFNQANAFGDAVFDLIEIIGHKSRLHRLLVV